MTTLRSQTLLHAFVGVAMLAMLVAAPTATAQTSSEYDDDDIEEVVVTGSQIRGADIGDALAVSVLTAEEIEATGITSGDELLALFPEHGQNFFSQAESISGGVNSVRGDIGAFNLRNLGTGNTLVLINGRRAVFDAGYQTEVVGGSFVPVMTANSNALPVSGLARVEILRDGASAIYGADAVAGVINTVLEKDYVGLKFTVQARTYDNLDRGGLSLNLKWGMDLANGANLGVYANHFSRDRVSAQEDPRWANADLRWRLPNDSRWKTSTAFRNNSINNIYGQFDLVSSASAAGVSGTLTDSAGEFELFPAGSSRCHFAINQHVCGARDDAGMARYNFNLNRDISPELTRNNVFVFFNHTLDSGLELFSEFSYYAAETNQSLHPSAPFPSVKLRVGANNYYNPFGPEGSANRLPANLFPVNDANKNGLALIIDNYRFTEVPRIVDTESTSLRLLQGFRGTLGLWDWEAAVVHSTSTRDDITSNRTSNTLMQEALNDSTAAAYNPFAGGNDSNLARALVTAYRKSEFTLTMIDAKFFHNELFNLGGGAAGLLVGGEYRDESFEDDRDPRLDGTIKFTDHEGDTFPFVSDLVNSSPTPDNMGDRQTLSLFAELALPITESFDMQVALRFEDYSDVDAATVGKVAFGWDIIDSVKLRGSWSQAHRVPNLVTINETIVARQNTPDDYVCHYIADKLAANISDATQRTAIFEALDFGDDDCGYSVQRRAQGSKDLVSEKSDNFSIGVVLTPVEGLTVTFDTWTIDKADTVGLFGETNHTLLELVNLVGHGSTNCSSLTDYAPVDRDTFTLTTAQATAFATATGICPVGNAIAINDRYRNLNSLKVEGYDVGVYYDLDTAAGKFTIKYNLAQLETFEQQADGDVGTLVKAKAAGTIPNEEKYVINGVGDLIGRDGQQKKRETWSVTWERGNMAASFQSSTIGSFYQAHLTLSDGTRFVIPSHTTYNARFDYTLNAGWMFASASVSPTSPTSVRRLQTGTTATLPMRTQTTAAASTSTPSLTSRS